MTGLTSMPRRSGWKETFDSLSDLANTVDGGRSVQRFHPGARRRDAAPGPSGRPDGFVRKALADLRQPRDGRYSARRARPGKRFGFAGPGMLARAGIGFTVGKIRHRTLRRGD